jgi:NTP pyrophosphatase (non-canonical NTP hydrolase)
MAAELDHIRGRLESIAEELADLAIDALREAIEAGDQGRPAKERRLTQARRSVERAASLLRDEEDPN